jgi:solute carrier family 25 (mitochondrial iron transporter), member 28/37
MDEEEWDSSRMPFITHMIAGSFGGLAEHVTVFPMDTLKTNMQCEVCGATAKEELWTCASKIVRNEGILRLWRGVSAMFIACIPAHAAYFSVYEGMKKYLITDNGSDAEHQPMRAALCGATASVSHDMFMTPFGKPFMRRVAMVFQLFTSILLTTCLFPLCRRSKAAYAAGVLQ